MSCPFCDYLAGVAPCAFISRTDQLASFVNPRQYERGALLIVPVEHRPSVFDMSTSALSAIHIEAARLGRALERAFGSTGLNIYQNNGKDAGQTVPHYHVHVVPRYAGSDPGQRFRERDFEPVPIAEQLEIAELIRGFVSFVSS